MKLPLIVAVALSLVACRTEASHRPQEYWNGFPSNNPFHGSHHYRQTYGGNYDDIDTQQEDVVKIAAIKRFIAENTVAMVEETMRLLDKYGFSNASKLLGDVAKALQKFKDSQGRLSNPGEKRRRRVHRGINY